MSTNLILFIRKNIYSEDYIEAGTNVYVMCPICKMIFDSSEDSEHFEYDDYVEENVCIWQECKCNITESEQLFICPPITYNAIHNNKIGIKQLLDGVEDIPCCVPLSTNEFMSENPDFKLPRQMKVEWTLYPDDEDDEIFTLDDYYIRRVGILQLTAFGRAKYSIDNSKYFNYYETDYDYKREYHSVNDKDRTPINDIIYLIKTNSDKIKNADLSFDGQLLFYEATCLECGKEHFSYRSGD